MCCPFHEMSWMRPETELDSVPEDFSYLLLVKEDVQIIMLKIETYFSSSHNHQRITRITKSIGLLGLQHYQLPFVMFLLNEVLVTRQLSNVRDSVIEHWISAINDNRDREAAMTFYIDHVAHPDKKTTSRMSPLPFESKTSLPDEDNTESDDETIVFDTRRDYEDVDIDNTPKPDENIDNTPKPYRAKHEDLTDIPPISVGLSRESW